MVVPLGQKFNLSYKDFPFALYQIQTKFRNEPRVKSGLLRGREFRMKDLYSFHTSIEDFKKYYERSKEVYFKVFERLGLKDETVIVLASGGSFTDDYSTNSRHFVKLEKTWYSMLKVKIFIIIVRSPQASLQRL